MLNQFLDKYIFTNTLTYKQNNFSLVNIPFTIFPVDLLLELVGQEDKEKLKEIYYIVKKSSKENFMPKFDELKMDGKKQVDFVKTLFMASGWGNIQIVDLDSEGKKAIVVVDNSPFAKELKGKAKNPVDVIIRGVLASLFSDVFKVDVECVESECMAVKGEHCKFVIKPHSEFDFTKKIVSEQLNVED
jgi:predicted hydrocarbon binding protein